MSAFAAQKPLSQRRLGGRKTSFSSSLVSSRDEPTVRILYSQLQKNKKLSLSGFIFYFWLELQDVIRNPAKYERLLENVHYIAFGLGITEMH